MKLDVRELLEALEAELEGFNEAEDQRQYLIGRLLAGFDKHIEPIDLPGPDALIDPAIKAFLGPMIGIIYDKLLAEKAAKRAG